MKKQLKITSERLTLTLATMEDAVELSLFYTDNYEFFRPFVPFIEGKAFVPAYWKHESRIREKEFQMKKSCKLIIRENESGILVGMIDYFALGRDEPDNVRVGFKLGEKFLGKGLMTEALTVSNEYMINDYKISSIGASYALSNSASKKLLLGQGFYELNGKTKVLKINGFDQLHQYVLKYV